MGWYARVAHIAARQLLDEAVPHVVGAHHRELAHLTAGPPDAASTVSSQRERVEQASMEGREARARAPLPAHQQAQRHGAGVLREEGEVDAREACGAPPRLSWRTARTHAPLGGSGARHRRVHARRDEGCEGANDRAREKRQSGREFLPPGASCSPLGMDGPSGEAAPAWKESSCAPVTAPRVVSDGGCREQLRELATRCHPRCRGVRGGAP